MIADTTASVIAIKPDDMRPLQAMMLVGDEKIGLKAIDSTTWVSDPTGSKPTLRSGDDPQISPITYVVRFTTADELRDFATSILNDVDSTVFDSIRRHVANEFREDSPVLASSIPGLDVRHDFPSSTNWIRPQALMTDVEFADVCARLKSGKTNDCEAFESIVEEASEDEIRETKVIEITEEFVASNVVDDVVDEDASDFVDAQLARILGRVKQARGERSLTRELNKMNAVENEIVPKETRQVVTLPVATGTFDNSYLNAEPTHKQNKNAVQEQMQAFRAVAETSARSALAKHSLNGLTKNLHFASGLTAVASIATAWHFVEFLRGREIHWANGILCAVVTIASARKMCQVLWQLNQWRLKKMTQPIALDALHTSTIAMNSGGMYNWIRNVAADGRKRSSEMIGKFFKTHRSTEANCSGIATANNLRPES